MAASLGILVIRSSLVDWWSMKKECRHARHSWDNVRSTTAPYTESRLTRSVANERVGFPVVEQVPKKKAKNLRKKLISSVGNLKDTAKKA